MRRSFQQILLAILVLTLGTILLVRLSPQFQAWRAAKPVDVWNNEKWYFQLDTTYTLPEIQEQQIHAPPRNYAGPGHETYATFYASRDSTMFDPYFIAAQQIVYRILWDPHSRTKKHPMTVFVAPFISQEQRNYFLAAGARVEELPLRPFVPDNAGASGRLRDMFSKLEMWTHTEYSKIAYLDSDAFPIDNVDSIFSISKAQTCKHELVPEEDQLMINDFCDYTFAGYNDHGQVNAGVMTFSPNVDMYERLVRLSLNQSSFDNGFMEQALLNVAYHPDGPFPPSYIPHAYNGGVDVKIAGKPLYIAHHKLWATDFEPADAWYKNVFNETWKEMLEFYKSADFRSLRLQDGQEDRQS